MFACGKTHRCESRNHRRIVDAIGHGWNANLDVLLLTEFQKVGAKSAVGADATADDHCMRISVSLKRPFEL